MQLRKVQTLNALLLLLPFSCAHGGHSEYSNKQQVMTSPNNDWATWHMAEEHHISNFDPATFFKLHDFDSSGSWSTEEIKRTYGLLNPEAEGIPDTKKDEVAAKIVSIFDKDGSDDVSYVEFVEGYKSGLKLPDFGLGPGHHGDDEYEYEIHHWERYHNDDTKEEDLTHPEDIAHFAKHEREEREAEKQAEMDKRTIIPENIPAKFLREL